MNAWPPKDPDEVLDYQFDWTARLAPSETIATSAMFRDSGSVVMNSNGVLSPITVVWLSGGTVGEVCVITNRIVTNQGRTYDESAKLRIRSTGP